MKRKLLQLLVCPYCKGPLQLHRRPDELWCLHDGLAFPVRDNIPVLLEMDARSLQPHEREKS